MLDKMLAFIAGILLQADYIVERGTSASNPSITYEKWKSGKIVYTQTYNSGFTFLKKSGGLYYDTTTFTLPSDVPQPQLLKQANGYFLSGNGLCGVESQTISANSVVYFVWCATQEISPIQKTILLIASGRWK